LHQFNAFFVVDVGKNGCGFFEVVGGFFYCSSTYSVILPILPLAMT
jgi:hypothetical protein